MQDGVSMTRREMMNEFAKFGLTGYVRGGCSPIGMKKKFPTFIEHHAMEQKTIRISAGKRGLQLEIAPQDLQQLTQATVFENHPDGVEA